MVNYKEIEVGKMYNEYTEEELALLPQLPLRITQTGKKVPYMWDGHLWMNVLID